MRITLTEPKTALAGVMLETSLARFEVSMATLNAERTLSRRFGLGRWDSWVQSRRDTRKCCGQQVVRKNPNPDGGGRQCIAQTGPFKGQAATWHVGGTNSTTRMYHVTAIERVLTTFRIVKTPKIRCREEYPGRDGRGQNRRIVIQLSLAHEHVNGGKCKHRPSKN